MLCPVRLGSLFFPVCLFVGFSFLAACDGNSSSEDGDSEPSQSNEDGDAGDPEKKMAIEFDVRIPVRDGTILSANVFRPDEDGEFPVIVAMTPYAKDDLPVDYEEDEDGKISVSEFAAFEQVDPAFWVPHGYVVVAVDCRGMGLSDGDTALFTELEAKDFYDVIEWLAKQDWSNGNIGLNGVSYMAINQWRVAQLHPPHLKAIMPWEGFTDLYRDVAYHGGIPENQFIQEWWQFRVQENISPNAKEQKIPQEIAETPLMGPLYESYSPQKLETITVPAYVGASWSDQGLHSRGTIWGFEKIKSEHKWMEVHGRKKLEVYYSQEAQERQLQFFDHFLAEKDSGILDVPSVRYEARASYYKGEDRSAETWPVADLDLFSLYLDPENNELSLRESKQDSLVSYSVESDDPQSEHVFFDYTFGESIEVTGSMNLELWVSLEDADDTDIFVGVQKLDENGEMVHFPGNDTDEGQVANGWLRASHRDLDPDKSLAHRPYHLHTDEKKFESDEIVAVQIEIHPSSTLFEKGQRLRVVIQGTDIEESGVRHNSLSQGRVNIHTGPSFPSRLTLRAEL